MPRIVRVQQLPQIRLPQPLQPLRFQLPRVQQAIPQMVPQPLPRIGLCARAVVSKNKIPSPAEIDLIRELSKPLAMEASLRAFLEKVFKDTEIMKAPDNVDDLIYNHYKATEKVQGVKAVANCELWKKFISDVWTVVKDQQILSQAFVQYSQPQVTLEALFRWTGSQENVTSELFRVLCDDFFYFHVSNGFAACRVYANAKFTHAPQVVAWLKKYISAGEATHGIKSFKLAGPVALAGRADVFVIYCESKQRAQTLASELTKLQGYFNDHIPAMTTRVQPGVGVSLGAEPESQATGVASPPKRATIEKFYSTHLAALRGRGYTEKAAREEAIWKAYRDAFAAQSFGGLRCELTSAAVYNYNANKEVVGHGFEIFARFVCAAFRGAGLNPMRPGD
jgi:hypothetical protein